MRPPLNPTGADAMTQREQDLQTISNLWGAVPERECRMLLEVCEEYLFPTIPDELAHHLVRILPDEAVHELAWMLRGYDHKQCAEEEAE
jgi:hypothetical protein